MLKKSCVQSGVCALIFMFAVLTCVQAQSSQFELCIQQKANRGSVSIFEVFAKNSGSEPLHLATSDFVFEFDEAHFCGTVNTEVKLDNQLLLLAYKQEVRDLSAMSSKAFGFQLIAPLLGSNVNTISDRILIVGEGESKRLCLVEVSTICEPNLPANIRFGSAGAFQTAIASYPELAPFAGREFLVEVSLRSCPDTPEDEDDSKVRVSPNPVRDIFSVEVDGLEFGTVRIEIVDVSGHTVQTFKKLSPGNGTIGNLRMPEDAPSGAYVLIVTDMSDVQLGSSSLIYTK